AAPTEDEQIPALGSEHLGLGDLARDAGDLPRTRPDHLLVVHGRVAHVAGDVIVLEAPDAVLETGRTGYYPRARERRLVAQIREVALRIRAEGHGDGQEGVEIGNEPRLGPVRQVAIGQQ